MERYRFTVDGMCCSRCVGAVRKALSRLAGVDEIEASSETDLGTVATDATAKESVQCAIQAIGFESVQGDVLLDKHSENNPLR